MSSAQWHPRAGRGVDRPGAKIRDFPSRRLGLVRQLVNREKAAPGAGWINRGDLDPRDAKAVFSLRRMMWLEHVDGRRFVVIPDTLRRGWTALRLRELTLIEFATFRDGCPTHADICRYWADLVNAETAAIIGA